jgi:hypothetical protein
MPNWNNLYDEVNAAGNAYDVVRRKYLHRLNDVTKRNVICYYSGWLQKPELSKPGFTGFSVNDNDKNGFMAVIHELDRKLGLDLVLHTPGGEIAATESLVDYLRSMFGGNIRIIIPQIAMSAGTMIALACREIMMGKHSSLGPIDPQIAGVAAHGIIEEFNRAKQEVSTNQLSALLWQPIIAKYTPTLIGECEKAILWSTEITKEWLVTGMFLGDADAEDKADKVIKELGDHSLTKSHARHISFTGAKNLGLNVSELEADHEVQDGVLSVHHAYIQTLAATPAVKIIENHLGIAYMSNATGPSQSAYAG